VWTGRVSDSIVYDPSTGTWKLTAENVLADLDRKLCAHLPEVSGLWINLNGSVGRSFIAHQFVNAGASGWLNYGYCVVTLTTEYYTWDLLHNTIAKALNATDAWVALPAGTAYTFDGTWTLERVDGKTELRVVSNYSGNNVVKISTSLPDTLDPLTVAYDDPDKTTQGAAQPCHALQALGFGVDGQIEIGLDSEGNGALSSEGEICDAYQPLHPSCNGGVLLVEQRGTDYLWDTQGDYEAVGGSAYACIMTEQATVHGEKDRKHAVAYTAQTFAERTLPLAFSRYAPELTLAPAAHRCWSTPPRAAFAGGPTLTWKQCWIPKSVDPYGVPIGPLRQLLPPLLSTGTEHYNHLTFDHCPPALSCCIPSALIDVASFIRADAQIRATYPASSRRWTLVSDATSWMELFLREARAYGYCTAFDTATGKIVCRPVFDLDLQDVTVNLDQSDGASPNDFPLIEMSVATVINQWECEIDHDPQDNKAQKVTISDRESIEGLGGIVKTAKLSHPGIRANSVSRSAIVSELTAAMLQTADLCRYPLHRIRRSLSAHRLTAVSVGDVVGVTYTVGYQDPNGSGARTLSAKALVLDVSWNHAEGPGECELLVLPQYEGADSRPWAPAALVDISAANAGYDTGSDTLTLVANAFGESTDEHDGDAFNVDGWKIQLIERAPADPTSVTPIAATVASYTTATRALVIDEDISASFDTSGETEYVIVPADWATAVAAQRLLGVWQAGTYSHLLGAADGANAYG